MLSDRLDNIANYYDILPSLMKISTSLFSFQENMEQFESNKRYSTLFCVDEGSFTCATTWREVSGGKDVTGAIKLEKGDFVLFLPKEQFLVKGTGKILKYTLE
ncbi:MAG: hypothetical protein K6G51_08405 [Sphaerochaetaceae bacterium]|nr:hypothetical protein [Sphaerochaetaceae bacterium]